MRLPLTLSKYIGRQFLVGIGVVFAVFISVVVIFEMLEIIRRSYSKDIPIALMFEMLAMRVPIKIQIFLPFVILLGGILSFTKLTRTSELAVTRSAGVSAWQFLTPAIMISFVLGIFMTTIFNPLSATMLVRNEQIEAKYLKGATSMLSVSSTGLWLRQKNEKGKNVVHALRVSPDSTELYDLTIYVFSGNNEFDSRVDAPIARLADGYWDITDALFTKPGQPVKKLNKLKLETNLSIHQIQDSFAPPETLSFWELPKFISTLKEAGFSAVRHSLYWQTLLVTPFLYSAMVFFAAAFSLKPPRQGKTGFMMVGGIVAGILIEFLSSLVEAIGLSGSIPISIAAWTPVIISILMGLAIMLHLEDG